MAGKASKNGRLAGLQWSASLCFANTTSLSRVVTTFHLLMVPFYRIDNITYEVYTYVPNVD